MPTVLMKAEVGLTLESQHQKITETPYCHRKTFIVAQKDVFSFCLKAFSDRLLSCRGVASCSIAQAHSKRIKLHSLVNNCTLGKKDDDKRGIIGNRSVSRVRLKLL